MQVNRGKRGRSCFDIVAKDVRWNLQFQVTREPKRPMPKKSRVWLARRFSTVVRPASRKECRWTRTGLVLNLKGGLHGLHGSDVGPRWQIVVHRPNGLGGRD